MFVFSIKIRIKVNIEQLHLTNSLILINVRKTKCISHITTVELQ